MPLFILQRGTSLTGVSRHLMVRSILACSAQRCQFHFNVALVLDGVEFSVLPSGLHLVEKDIV